MAVAREPSPPIAMPHSIQSYQGSSADGGDNESVMSDLSWDGTPDENILSGSSRAATSLAIREEDEGKSDLRFLDDPDGDHTLIMEDDVYHQLAEMEEKLKMAGEFGNALLEENQELRILNQQMKQETSAKIEALEQERHELRMKLETANTEKENMSYDLRMEVESLRKELTNQSDALKVANSNKQGIIGELMEQKDQSQKLAAQLEEMKRERDSIHDRLKIAEQQNESMSLFHHESSLGKSEQLRMEVVALKDENHILGERLVAVSSEHVTMMSNVEEAKERNMMLEKQVVELEQRLQFREAELRDLSRLHEETMQELGAARSRANTHCSSSLYDELETAELTGYESSEEDLEIDDKANVMMSKFLGSQSRQRSLAEELAESLGTMESTRMGHPMGMREMSLAEEMNMADQTPRDEEKKILEEFVERVDRADLTDEAFKQNDQCSTDAMQHHMSSLADEMEGAAYESQQAHGNISPGIPSQEGMNNLHSLPKSGNTLSLADELSQIASFPLNGKPLDASLGAFGDANIQEDGRQSGFILGADEDGEEDDDERMMLGVPMATQCLNQGLSLADELADMGYQQSYKDHDADEEESVIGGCDALGKSDQGGEMVASRVREGGGGGGGGLELEDDDAEVTSLDTPKASPSRSPKPQENFQIKYRQIEDVMHWVHVTLTHIILELHSLVRLPLTDQGIMHASSVLHSPHPTSSSHPHVTPWTASPPVVNLDDDDEDAGGEDDDGGGRRSELIGDKVKSQLSVLRSMLSIVNGSPKVLNGAYRGRQEDQERIGQLEGHAEALERELKDTRLQVDLLEAEIDRLDRMLWRKEEQIDRLQQGRKRMEDCVIQIEEEERALRMDAGRDLARHQSDLENTGINDQGMQVQNMDFHPYRHDGRGPGNSSWQELEPHESMAGGHSSGALNVPSSTNSLAPSFSSRSQSAPEFGRKNTFTFWS